MEARFGLRPATRNPAARLLTIARNVSIDGLLTSRASANAESPSRKRSKVPFSHSDPPDDR